MKIRRIEVGGRVGARGLGISGVGMGKAFIPDTGIDSGDLAPIPAHVDPGESALVDHQSRNGSDHL